MPSYVYILYDQTLKKKRFSFFFLKYFHSFVDAFIYLYNFYASFTTVTFPSTLTTTPHKNKKHFNKFYHYNNKNERIWGKENISRKIFPRKNWVIPRVVCMKQKINKLKKKENTKFKMVSFFQKKLIISYYYYHQSRMFYLFIVINNC